MPLELDQSSYWDDKDHDNIIDGDETVYYDLTSKTGSQALINGALFFNEQPDTSSGTGLIQAFVRLQDGGGGPGDGTESGYNTSDRPLSYEENTSPTFTKSILLSEVPIVEINGIQYYEFRLDINQLDSSPLLSLDALKLYTSDVTSGDLSGLITSASFTSLTTLVYDLDALQDSSILLDYSLQPGSGRSDMFFYVEVDQVLDPDGPGGTPALNPEETYITLYSEFGAVGELGDTEDLKEIDDSLQNNAVWTFTDDGTGDNPDLIEGYYGANDGFEEWSVSKELGLFISGFKWEDTNGNGVWDAGEEGLADWQISYSYTVKIKGVDVVISGVVETADGVTDDLDGDGVIDDIGYYVIPLDFTNKNYNVTITESAPGAAIGDLDGWVNTYDGDGGSDGQIVFSYNKNDDPEDLPQGVSGTAGELDFGNFELFDISGYKYEDSDGDGSASGESGLAGWTIFIDADDDGVLDAGEKFDITDSNGYWEITGLDWTYDGYSVKEVSQSGWVQTLGPVSDIVATSGNDGQTFDFANFENMSLSGYKFEDINGDTNWNGSDDGLENWTIVIDTDTDPTNGYLLSDVTDSNGKYEFTGLNPFTAIAANGLIPAGELGDYAGQTLYVYEIGKSDWVQTYDGGFDFELESGYTHNAADSSAEEGNFGNFELFDISGTKYEDSDGDGSASGESGLGGWTIFIDTNDDGFLDWTDAGSLNGEWDPGEGERWTLTASDGTWSMTDLDASYNDLPVKEILQSGWVQTLGPVADIVATSGNDGQTFDFANFENMSLSGYKFEDINGDTNWNGSDDGLENWTIVIDTDTDPTNGYLLSDVTDSNGKYEFTGLNPFTAIAANGLIPAGELGDYAGQTLYVYEIGQNDWIQTYDGGFDFELESGYTHNAADGSAEEGNFGNFEPDPSIDIEKSVKTNLFDYQPEDADDDPDGLLAGTSSTVTFKLVVTNTGNETLSSITLSDSVLHTVNGSTTSQVIVYSSDGDSSTLDAQNVFVDLNNNQIMDAGEAWINFDTDGDGTIDAGGIEELAPGESFTIYYDLTSQLGQHENTGSVEAVSAISVSTVSDSDDANYYVLPEDCVGVGTPGFWANNGWVFWDGDAATVSKHIGEPGFADHELLYNVTDTNADGVVDGDDVPGGAIGLLLGDYDGDGIANDGDDAIFITLEAAQMLIDASNRQLNGKQADGVWILGRDAVASWLNYLANGGDEGDCFGSSGDPNSPTSYMNEAIDWLLQYGDKDGDGDIDKFDLTTGAKVKTSSNAWQNDGGSEAHQALDEYNNFGTIDDVVYCCDRDDAAAIFAIQQVKDYLSEQETLSLYSGIGTDPVQDDLSLYLAGNTVV